MRLSDVTPGKRIFGMLKGEPGTGKTLAAASFAKLGRTYIFDCEGRIAPIVTYYSKIAPEVIQNIEFDTYTSYFALKSKLEAFKVSCPYKTIIIDSLTSLADLILRQIFGAKGDKGKKVGGIKVTDLEDFGGESSGLMEVLDLSRVIKAHMLWTAHVLVVTEKVGMATHVSRSLLTGGKKIGAKLPAYFDEVYHFNVEADMDVAKGPTYTALTRHVGEDWSKTALDLPPRIDFTNKLFVEELIKYAPAIAGDVTEAGVAPEDSWS